MNTKIITSLATVVIALSPAASGLADNAGYAQTMATAAWNHGDYRVERLAFSDQAIGPFKLGQHTLVAEPSDSCRPTIDCDRYDLYKLQNGAAYLIENVPFDAFASQRFELNESRLVYSVPIDDNHNHYSVVEEELSNGLTKVLIDDVFFTGVVRNNVMVEGAYVYFNPEFDFQNSGIDKYRQAGVYTWHPQESKAHPIVKHWELRREEIQDVHNGIVLVKMVFQSGNKELWLMNSNDNTMKAIRGTWTDPHEDIFAAHFKSDGSIEYFQNYVRHTYNPLTDERVVRHEGETINWFRPINEAYQIVGDNLAWVDEKDNLFMSNGQVTLSFGHTPNGQFKLEDDRLLHGTISTAINYSTAGIVIEGEIYNFATGVEDLYEFAPTDSFDEFIVGLNSLGQVMYQNTKTGAVLELGSGENVVITDQSHVYWKAAGGIYEATVSLSAKTNLSPVRAWRSDYSATVYIVNEDVRYSVPSEEVFYTWFDSMDEVEFVPEEVLSSINMAGVAQFAPGTKVKAFGDPKVYVVGNDSKLHWIINQNVAFAIYGSVWNKDIHEKHLYKLVDYQFGDNIMTERDMQNI
ncbi:hypothetical protein ACFLZY_00875 [Patescibacteria group bacterium]